MVMAWLVDCCKDFVLCLHVRLQCYHTISPVWTLSFRTLWHSFTRLTADNQSLDLKFVSLLSSTMGKQHSQNGGSKGAKKDGKTKKKQKQKKGVKAQSSGVSVKEVAQLEAGLKDAHHLNSKHHCSH